jgi:hypothetical protein
VRGRRFKTQADIDRYIKQGYGQGEGSAYIPWLRVQDVPSEGRSRKVQGIKTQRLHQFLSDGEFSYFLLLEFSEQVIDIREQFPLFPTTQSLEIARQMGIQYPRYKDTQLNFVLTSDFLITLQNPDGTRRLAARSFKCEDALLPSPELKRTIEKLELEKAIFQEQDIHDWKIVTEKTIGSTLANNLIWLRAGRSIDQHLQDQALHILFLDSLEFYSSGERTLASTIRSSAVVAKISYADGILLFKHLVLSKRIKLDIKNQELKITGICPSLALNGASKPSSIIQKAA